MFHLRTSSFGIFRNQVYTCGAASGTSYLSSVLLGGFLVFAEILCYLCFVWIGRENERKENKEEKIKKKITFLSYYLNVEKIIKKKMKVIQK